MTLRAIEIVESCLNFFANAMKTIRRSRMFASQAPQTRFAKMQTGSVEKVGVEPDPKRVGPASWNLEYG